MSSSRSDQKTETTTNDERIVASDNAVAINAQGAVTFNQVPDEVFELGGEVVAALERVTMLETKQDRSEGAQLGDAVIKVGIPAAALAFVTYLLVQK